MKRHYKENVIIALMDQGLTQAEIAKESCIGQRQVRHIVERELARREAKADPDIDPTTLITSAQEKLNAAIRQHKKKLDIEFEWRVLREVKRRIESTVLPSLNDREAKAAQIIKARKGVMRREEYRSVLSCLHPDRVPEELKQRYSEAFHLFKSLELLLVAEKELPMSGKALPKTWAEVVNKK